ncbi:MAG: C40 family peptidase [Bacteroidetes bacterium]|nr:C40 family peptidase [Bacteroidota bacterium]
MYYSLLEKQYLLILVLLFGLNIKTEGAVVDSLLLNKVNSIIKEVKHKYAPDKRTEIFNTSLSASDSLVLNIETTKTEAIIALKERFDQLKIVIRLNEQLLPSKELGDQTFGVANLSVCNNRLDPDNDAEMVTQVTLGTPVKILKKEKGYYLVQSPDHYISWTDVDGITRMNENEYHKWISSNLIVFTKGYGHSFEKPSLVSMPISDLVAGNMLKLKGTDHRFYKALYPDGRIAYIPKRSCTLFRKWISRPNPTANKIIETAKTLNGVPYLWGGTSIKGVDCSGFTKTCYFLNGIIIPRDASQQALVGEKIDIYENDTVNITKCLRNLKAGDLLFFAGGKYRHSNPKITHTAIYMGNGVFIQSAGMVRINNMVPNSKAYDDFESRTLVCARRILSSIGSSEISRIDQHPFYKFASK